jgi:hypothetical protein
VRPSSRPLALLAALAVTSSCSGLATLGIQQKDGLERVDELLAHVERVQVESVVSKERAQAALERLRALVAPEFIGDAILSHQQLVSAVELSADQAEALQDKVRPLKRVGESVFARWTADLESFGNIAMRQRSQERLEETRKRYEAILSAALSAQLAFDAFNRDLSDHALFLEHDFNSSSVQVVAQELDGLRTRGKELARRLDACAAACQAYTESSAPMGQVAPPQDPKTAPKTESEPSAPAKPAPKKKASPTSSKGG